MIILHGEHLSFSSGEHQILTDVTFQLQEKDRMGIVGINGAGKSTLFRLITSDLAPTGGHIGKTGNKRIGMLAQNDIFQGTGTVLSEMLCAFSPLLEMQRQLQTLQAQMEISEEKQTSEKADHSPSDLSFFDTNSDKKAQPIQTIKTWMYPHPLPLNFKTKHSGKRCLHSAMPFCMSPTVLPEV